VDADVVIGDLGTLGDRLAGVLEAGVRAMPGDRAAFTLALSGGSVATELFPRLAAADVDWERTEFFWVDERAVPPASPESNYGVAAALWLWPAGVPPERIHPMPADDPDLARAARRYSDELERRAGRPPRLDLVILGVGPDGHVASLFPGHPRLDSDALVVPVEDSPKPPRRRLSLTLPLLAGARRVVVGAFGESKAAAIHAALEEQDSPLPVARLARLASQPIFLLDASAASKLGGR
jgi:6-phosphogluconolactonase